VSSLFLMSTITDRRTADAFLQLYEAHGVNVTLRTVGTGTAVQETLSTLGLEKTEKAVLLAVVTAQTWQEVQRDLRRKMRIDVPGTGIAFTVPLSSIGGKRALGFLTEHQTLTWKEESTLKDTRYELLLVIANQGYTGSIMDAARSRCRRRHRDPRKGHRHGRGSSLSGHGTGEREGAGAHREPHRAEEPDHESHHGRGRPQGGGHRVLAAGHRHRRSAPAGRGRTGCKIIKKG
jgi:hypothetical protein